MTLNICRSCGSSQIKVLDSGIYAPFFIFKVSSFIKDENYLRFKTVSLHDGRNIIVQDSTSIIFCEECSFISPKKCFTSEDLSELYKNYRSLEYNRQRICFEPNYQSIADMFEDDHFLENRKKACWDFLSKSIKHKKFKTVCDFGGADGKPIPENLIEISDKIIINDVSDVGLCNKKFIKQNIIEDESIDLGLCMHVLEHLGSPAEYFREMLKKIKPNGYLYIEVPLEIDDIFINNLKNQNIFVTLHEHINKYCEKSLKYLAITNNVEIIDFGKINEHIGMIVQKQEK